jgi:hypothetical protein
MNGISKSLITPSAQERVGNANVSNAGQVRHHHQSGEAREIATLCEMSTIVQQGRVQSNVPHKSLDISGESKRTRRGRIEYLVQWKGRPDSENSWQKIEV